MNNKFKNLNLELRNVDSHEIKTNEFKHDCYFNKTFNHMLHSDNPQLNSMVDMVLILSKNIEELNNNQGILLQKINQLLEENTLDTKTIRLNQQYMKDQIETMIKNTPINQEQTTINNLTRQIERIEKNHEIIEYMLENIKSIVLS